jgi:hypothetical protein
VQQFIPFIGWWIAGDEAAMRRSSVVVWEAFSTSRQGTCILMLTGLISILSSPCCCSVQLTRPASHAHLQASRYAFSLTICIRSLSLLTTFLGFHAFVMLAWLEDEYVLCSVSLHMCMPCAAILVLECMPAWVTE